MAFSPEMTMKLGQSFLRESFLLCLFRRAILAALLVGSSLPFSVDAKAADLWNAAAPLSFAGVCDSDENGSFVLPGTQDCFEIGGLVHPDASLSENGSRDMIVDALLESGVLGESQDVAITRLVFAYTAPLGEDFSTTLTFEPQPQAASPAPGPSGTQDNSSFVADITLDRPWEQGVHAEFGSEVKGGFEFSTDMIAAGDKMWLQAAFEKSPENSVASDNLKWAFAPKSGDASVSPQGYNFGWNPQAPSDCVYSGVAAAAANCNKPGSLSIEGALKHYWAPDLSSTVSGTNLSTDYDPNALARLGGTVGDTQETRVGGSSVAMPMKGLDLGTEFMYLRLTQENAAAHPPKEGGTSLNADNAPAPKTGASENENHPQGENRIRVQRQY
jgi:hypothetical protein